MLLHPRCCANSDIPGVVGDSPSDKDAAAAGHRFYAVARSGGSGSQSATTGGCRLRCSPTRCRKGMRRGSRARTSARVTPMLYYKASTEEVDGSIRCANSQSPTITASKCGAGRASMAPASADRRNGAAGDWEVDGVPHRGHRSSRLCRPAGREDSIKAAPSDRLGCEAVCGGTVEKLTAKLPERAFCCSPTSVAISRAIIDPPKRRNLADLQLVAERASISASLSGDGDRIGAIDGEGRVIWAINAANLCRGTAAARRDDHRRCEGQPGAVRRVSNSAPGL